MNITDRSHGMSRMPEPSHATAEWWGRTLRVQKTSHEMTEDELDGADWQDGYDTMVEETRVVLAEYDATHSALRAELETFTDCLRVVCHHLELPHSDSGPADDPALYDGALKNMDVRYRDTEQERAAHAQARWNAEAEAAALRAELKQAQEALQEIEAIEPRAKLPWTHEQAADEYWSVIDRIRARARAFLDRGAVMMDVAANDK